TQDQPYLGAGRVELEEPLAQKRDEQARRERQGVTSDETRVLDVALAVAQAAKECVAVGLVDLEAESEDGDVICHPPPWPGERCPQLLVAVPIERRLEELDDEERQLIRSVRAESAVAGHAH